MPKYRKKPVIVEAVQLTESILIHTPEGDMVGNPGDWLITGVNGEQYPCKDEIFQKTYEPVLTMNTSTTNRSKRCTIVLVITVMCLMCMFGNGVYHDQTTS